MFSTDVKIAFDKVLAQLLDITAEQMQARPSYAAMDAAYEALAGRTIAVTFDRITKVGTARTFINLYAVSATLIPR